MMKTNVYITVGDDGLIVRTKEGRSYVVPSGYSVSVAADGNGGFTMTLREQIRLWLLTKFTPSIRLLTRVIRRMQK